MVAIRYINRELILVFLVTVSVLFAVAVGGRFIGYLQEAAMGRYSAQTVFYILWLRVPEFLQLIVPFSFGTAMLLTLARLFADQEMVVLQSGGASTTRVVGWLSWSMLGVSSLVALLTLQVTPSSVATLREFLDAARAQAEFQAVNPGIFHVYDTGRRVTYSEAMSDDRKELNGVFLNEQRDDGMHIMVWAEHGAQYVDASTGSQFLLLSRGRRYEALPGSNAYRVVEFDKLGQRLEVNLEARAPRIEVRSTPEVLEAARGDPGPGAWRAEAEWQWRLSLPLYCVIGGLLAAGMARARPRQGRFARIVPGMLVLLAYFATLMAMRNALAEGDVPAALGLWPVHLVFGTVALWMLYRVGRPVSA